MANQLHIINTILLIEVAISYDGYITARTTIAEMKALHDNALALINDIKKQTVAFVTVETELAAKLNAAVTDTYNQVTVVQPKKNEAIRNESKARSNKRAAWFFYFFVFILFFGFITKEPKTFNDFEGALFGFVLFGGIGYLFDRRSKAFEDSEISGTQSGSHSQQRATVQERQENNTPPRSQPHVIENKEELLMQLKKLLDADGITREEFDNKKNKLLND
jgi:hypothetical protein